MPPCDPKPACVVSVDDAKKRLDLFNGHKKSVLDQCLGGGMSEVSCVQYTVIGFLKLLNFIITPSFQYSGMRAYFASYPKTISDPGGEDVPDSSYFGKMTLIFVPTRTVGGVEQDDLYNCMVIDRNKLVLIDGPFSPSGQDNVSSWIKNFQTKFPILEPNGANYTQNGYFKETKSLWYDADNFRETPNDRGLISYINCLIGPSVGQLDKIVAQFACFFEHDSPPEAWFQLTLLFELHQPGQGLDKISLLGSTSFLKANIKGSAKAATDNSADTGLPCPPLKGCQGSMLPVA